MNTLFDIRPYKILSASRMTDMPKYYPKEIIKEVNSRIEKGINVHTLVLWTKHPKSILANPLREFLKGLKNTGTQLYIQLTITGMGKVIVGEQKNGAPLLLEPNAPAYEESLLILPELIDFIGKPERIRLRIDPIIRLKDAKGKEYSSLNYFPLILKEASKEGIKTISFSFMESGMHKKVDRRIKSLGCEILPPSQEEREKTKTWFKKLEEQYGVNIYSCCVPGFPVSKCIDGELLQELHDLKLPVGLKQPKKRVLCGCTESIDIGGWPPKVCFTGCAYCYANVDFITEND